MLLCLHLLTWTSKCALLFYASLHYDGFFVIENPMTSLVRSLFFYMLQCYVWCLISNVFFICFAATSDLMPDPLFWFPLSWLHTHGWPIYLLYALSTPPSLGLGNMGLAHQSQFGCGQIATLFSVCEGLSYGVLTGSGFIRKFWLQWSPGSNSHTWTPMHIVGLLESNPCSLYACMTRFMYCGTASIIYHNTLQNIICRFWVAKKHAGGCGAGAMLGGEGWWPITPTAKDVGASKGGSGSNKARRIPYALHVLLFDYELVGKRGTEAVVLFLNYRGQT